MSIKKMVLFTATLTMSSLSYAQPQGKMADMSKEERNRMADMHTKMAECLKSDKDFSECHKAIMEACSEMSPACPMMKSQPKSHGRRMKTSSPKKMTTPEENKDSDKNSPKPPP